MKDIISLYNSVTLLKFSLEASTAPLAGLSWAVLAGAKIAAEILSLR